MDAIPLEALFGALVILLILSAFFSGSETALMTLNRYRLRHKVKDGHQGAKKAQRLLEKPDRLISLILLGNNFVNILASSLVTLIAIRLGGEGAIPIAAGILTLVILIFSEVAPKTLAALHPEKLAFPAAFIYTPLLRLLLPLVWLINIFAMSILKLFRIFPKDANKDSLNQEELRTVLNEASALMPKKHQNMLLGVLDLERVKVDDIMVPRTELNGINIENDINEILNQLENLPYTRILVYKGSIDNVIGFLHSRIILKASLEIEELTHENIKGLLREPLYVPKGTSLNRQLLNFQRTKRRIGLVVDEYGDVLGLITMTDILEEIVGEFATDPSDDMVDVQAQADGSFLVSGSANLRELVKNLDWDFPTDGPKTLNGLIIEHLQTLPEAGTSIMIYGYPIDIIQSKDNMVKTAVIRPLERKKS